jgi:NAD(P)-dependent dehydrogenase (short-subunit alcohol dehydrogenase family)
MFGGKVAIVTGASSGLGREIAIALAAAGATLVLAARSETGLTETARRFPPSSATPLIVPGDLTRPEVCRGLINAALERFGRLDYLVLAAGRGMWARLDAVTEPRLFADLIATNFLSAAYCAHAALPHLKQSGGLIAVISSLQGRVGVPLHTGYAASKHALHGFFDSLQAELGPEPPAILMVLPHWLSGTGLRPGAAGPDGGAVGAAARPHKGYALSVAEAARRVVKAMGERRREIVLPARMRALLWLNRLAPGLTASLVRRRMSREAAEDDVGER